MFGALLVLLLTGRSWADLAEGLNAYYKGDWATAVREFRTLAEQGDAPAQYKLGTMYLMGFGVPQDHAQSKHWFGLAAEQGFAPTPELAPEMLIRIAAERGDADYQYQLGDMYLRGKGFIGEDVPQDYAQAVHWFGLAAKQGNEHSQYQLGIMYDKGQGLPQDGAQAAHWLRLAAEQAHVGAQDKLGEIYLNGRGVPQDYAEALHWFRLMAEEGRSHGQFQLAGMYLNGRGVPQDYAQAAHWLRLAAEKGHVGAQYVLGEMYLRGGGVSQDYAQAVHWFGLAAEQGDKHSQYKLGAMYAIGKGIEQDDVSAHMWLNLAAAQGDDDAQKGRDLIAKQMPAAKIAKAQHRARICLLQQRLKDFREDPGPCDGIMGIKTHAALRAFQRKRGLPVTGEPDEGTLKLLGLH
jgi:hypothetical protein